MTDRSRIALIRGEGLADVELDYLVHAASRVELVPIGRESAALGWGAQLLSRLSGARGSFVLSKLSPSGRELARSCDALWFVDPYLRMTIDGATWARKLQIPYVITVWENLMSHPSLRIPAWRSRSLEALRNAAVIHCVTPRAAEYVLAFDDALAPSLVIVPPGVDGSRFEPASDPKGGVHRFLFVGRLVREKGVEQLLAAYEGCRQIVPCELVIAGSGPLEGAVRRAASSSTGINYIGFQARAALPAVFRSCHTLVLPSRRRTVLGWPIWEEQFGFVLVEAMMSGLAVVASRSGSIPFVVDDAGWLVDPGGGVRALQEAMALAASDPAEWHRCRDLGARRARREFDAAANADALLDIICRAVG